MMNPSERIRARPDLRRPSDGLYLTFQSLSYLNYKGLKKIIKQISEAKDGESRDNDVLNKTLSTSSFSTLSETVLAPFFFALDRNTESVDSFFNSKFAEYCRRLKHVEERYSLSLNPKNFDFEELEDLMGVLVELRSQFRKLQWYAEVNKRGFVKILKKFDKKIGTHTQMKYITSKISILPFSNGGLIDEKLAVVNNYLTRISPFVAKEREEEEAVVADDDNARLRLNERAGHVLEISSNGGTTSDSGAVGEMKAAISNNDMQSLNNVLSDDSSPTISQKTLLSLLFKAISIKSTACFQPLLNRINSLNETDELNGRNVIHRMIINHGRQRNKKSNAVPSGLPAPQQDHHSMNFLHPAVVPHAATNLMKALGSDGENSTDDETVLDYFLSCLNENQQQAIVSRDHHNRSPLHYSSHYGLKLMTTVLLKYMKKWDYLTNIIDKEWRDSEDVTPIQLSVSGNHPKTSKVLLEVINPDPATKLQLERELLPIASQLGSKNLLEVLLAYGLNVNFTDDSLNNETSLFICSKLNHIEAVQFLIDNKADTEISENTYGWTPVFVAAVDGFREVVRILLSGGSKIDIVDGSGWNAMEHACLRGHFDLVDILKPSVLFKPVFSEVNGSDSDISVKSINTNTTAIKSGKTLNTTEQQPSTIDTIKTFGHRYLKDKSMVLVTIGTTDLRQMTNPVQLDRVPYSKAHSTQLDTALSLIVSTSGCSGEPVVIDLPIPDYGLSTEPLSFYTDDIDKVKLYFDLVPTYSGNQKRILGRGVALLSTIYTPIGNKKRSLHETVTLPIVESETLEVLGTIKFGFLVITPFDHPKMGIEKSATYWKSLITTRVIGHRGLGKNTTNKKSLQLGENTIESFIQAASLGASYVEFDVQLTKDHVPVIYHDFLVGETGIDIPMQSLTLEQFLDSARGSSGSSGVSAVGGGNGINSNNPQRMPSPDGRPPRQRSQSVFVSTSMSSERADEYDEMSEKMKHTRDFKLKGFKGNFRGHSIQSPFTTLVDAFKTLPKHVGFNIECKYPMLDESEAEDMEGFAFELNLWCDTVLKCVYDYADGRDIIFSSFHPDICLMLSLKQPSIPILFLTESGTTPMADIRASSLQEGIRFAKRWNLLGIVSECTPLIKCPRLVNVVKASGLVCVTYGTDNNDPINARLQMKSGVDAVIVDSVLAVRKGLTNEE